MDFGLCTQSKSTMKFRNAPQGGVDFFGAVAVDGDQYITN
jgi:hypothetical protein